jgi:hydroxymethylpyrimidine pyrophosphatase-like HAD family hydrolase
MKFLAIALDYDGTIAKDDVLDSKVREAIAELRAQNIVVLIVTGRIMEDLRRVAGDLHFVDGVVAENGAVIEFTDSGYSKVIGTPPPANFLDALRREGCLFKAGQSIVETDASEAPRLLAIIQKLELPLVLVFNRGRVMVLPQATSKATGLREALKMLRLSPHNAIAIGDAENDHELLRSCEVGVAVAWGSEALKASADYILTGDGPASVADYMRALMQSHRIPAPLKTRRRIFLGHTDSGKPLTLAVRGRTVLVTGDTKSGKSWVTGLLCEQLIVYGYSLLIIDPEGDYISLEALPGVTVCGGTDPLPRPRDLLRSLRHADASVVIDLSHTPYEQKFEYVRNLLVGVATLRRRTGLPHRIVVDEAHYFLHDRNVKELLDMDLGAYTLVTYRASYLHQDVLATAEAIVVTRESDLNEVSELRRLCHSCQGPMSEQKWEQLLGSLMIGEAVALPLTAEAEGTVQRIHLAPRLTSHARHVSKYIDIPVQERDQFVFWHDGSPSGQKARTLHQFVSIIEHLPTAALNGHLHRSDFSKWIANVFGDYPLAKTVQQYEEDYRSGMISEVVSDLVEAIRSRYDFVDPLAGPHH